MATTPAPAAPPTQTPTMQAPPATPTPTAPADATGPLQRVSLARVFPALSFQRPTGLYQAPGDSSRFFVLEQTGRILVFDNRPDAAEARVFLDISDRVTVSSEEGLLGLAFAPDFATSGSFYVNYSAPNPRRSVISRFVAPAPLTAADPRSETVILSVNQPFANHNGGQTSFGPDGYLYIGLGDGGSARDPQRNGQNLGTLLGKLLRIDVSGTGNGLAYRIPPDNPFVGRAGARPEVYAFGLRNPWRFGWDARTGALWLADVGQNALEEVDIITPGGNYGWSVMEGNQCLGGGAGCDNAGMVPPVFVYPTAGGNCSITGGFVYRGQALASLRGAYVYGDYCSGKVWALRYDGSRVTEQAEIADGPFTLSSFGFDAQGELYALAYSSGGIFKLTP
jgi:glucose/arabinose dehydrogenase